jgi:pre-mRNA-processing factor 19
MSFNICSLSGNICEEPVITKDGYVFEKRLIEKVIETTGKCPITRVNLSKDELIVVKTDVVKKPRSIKTTSVPGMFDDLQSEWDSLILETYTNKKQLDIAKQELSHALYRHDAALRVIANLVKERDSIRDEILSYRMPVEGVDDEENSQQA